MRYTGIPMTAGTWVDIPADGATPKPGEVTCRVSRLRVGPESVDAVIRRNTVRKSSYEGAVTLHPVSEEIQIHLDLSLSGNCGVAWVYTTAGKAALARTALMDVLGAGFQSDPVAFRFSHLEALRTSLGLCPLAFEGPDETGKFGTVGYGGREVESYRECLDESDPRFVQQWGPGKSRYEFGFRHTHVDGYAERVEVRLMMNKHPSITFLKRASQDAISGFVAEIARLAI